MSERPYSVRAAPYPIGYYEIMDGDCRVMLLPTESAARDMAWLLNRAQWMRALDIKPDIAVEGDPQ